MIASSPTKNIEAIIRSFKTTVTKELGYFIWQRLYHDHMIRGKKDFQKIWEYIDTNILNGKNIVFITSKSSRKIARAF